MQRTVILGIATLAAACASPKAPPCSSATGSTVTVQGVASQRLKPEGVSFSVGVETRATSVVEAFNANARKVERVVAALKAGGVAADQIQTSELSVSSLTSNSGALTGFRVSNQVTVRRPDVAGAASLIEAAVSAGANQVGSLQFLVSDKAAARRKGLELAVANARSKAEALAALSSRNLGGVVCISDAQPSEPALERLASLGYASPGLESGLQDIRSAVSVVFELK